MPVEYVDAQLHQSIGELHGKVDVILERALDFDTRLRSVEHKQYWLAGVSAAVVFAITNKLAFLKGLMG
jgi:hypothetical protein